MKQSDVRLANHLLDTLQFCQYARATYSYVDGILVLKARVDGTPEHKLDSTQKERVLTCLEEYCETILGDLGVDLTPEEEPEKSA